jgi:ATP-dependent DNA helicase RecQ
VADVLAVQVTRGGGRTGGARRPGTRSPAPGGASRPMPESLDGAILDTVAHARPPVGRTRAVEVLRGGRSKVIAQHGYDELPAYGAFAGLTAGEVLGRVDELLDEGVLVSTGGRFPKLAIGAGAPA